jgi:hypothetical protein
MLTPTGVPDKPGVGRPALARQQFKASEQSGLAGPAPLVQPILSAPSI